MVLSISIRGAVASKYSKKSSERCMSSCGFPEGSRSRQMSVRQQSRMRAQRTSNTPRLL